ncbi:MAG TPA: hypothetical protein VGK20_08730 [Candidatus Binatia bacterium]|jgi:hypothetical protein
MKSYRSLTSTTLGVALGVLASVAVASAQTVTTSSSKTTTYSGVVSEMNPSTSTIILKSDESSAPVTYNYSKETTFVDANGKTVSSEAILNSPVTVEYSNEGGRTVVTRVVQTGPARTVKESTTHSETTTR